MLSIVIPVYNYDCTPLLQQLVKQSLSSTLPTEIIVCDDASSDLISKKVNQAYCAAQDVLYIENSSNLGRTATRTILAQKSNYDWLLFLDADVLPVSGDFITGYTKYLDNAYQAIIGGIKYEKSRPEKNFKLRWKFGIKRESRTANFRLNHPYLLASGNILIKKGQFLKANSFLKNHYGLDAFFGYQLKKLKTPIHHIDNPVYHLGLETNVVFLDKSIKALQTMVALEKQGSLPSDHTRLQQLYQSMIGKSLVLKLINLFIHPIKKNLLSNRPSLFLFDLYRLYAYIKLKSNA